MKKLAIYPYHHDVEILLKYKELLEEYEIVNISSFKEDAHQLHQLQIKYEIFEVNNLFEAVKSVDYLLLCEPVFEYISPKYIATVAKLQDSDIDADFKKILVNKSLLQRLEKNPELKITQYSILSNEYQMQSKLKSELLQIPVPVIAIAGLGEKCSKFETQLLIKKVIEDMGFKSVSLSSNPLGSLFGMFTLPEFLFQKNYSYQQKVIQLNHYVYDMCKNLNPDVLIIGFPSGIMPLGEGAYNYFAEIPSIISNALSIDLGILNIYFEPNIEEGYLEKLQNYCLQKFGFEIDAFCMSNQRVEYSLAEKKFEYYCFAEDFMQKILPDINAFKYPLISLNDRKKAEEKVRLLINLLEENLSIV